MVRGSPQSASTHSNKDLGLDLSRLREPIPAQYEPDSLASEWANAEMYRKIPDDDYFAEEYPFGMYGPPQSEPVHHFPRALHTDTSDNSFHHFVSPIFNHYHDQDRDSRSQNEIPKLGVTKTPLERPSLPIEAEHSDEDNRLTPLPNWVPSLQQRSWLLSLAGGANGDALSDFIHEHMRGEEQIHHGPSSTSIRGHKRTFGGKLPNLLMFTDNQNTRSNSNNNNHRGSSSSASTPSINIGGRPLKLGAVDDKRKKRREKRTTVSRSRG